MQESKKKGYDKIFIIACDRDGHECFYLFPSGGQEKEEELRKAVARECIEEIGCEVEVGDILYVREYIGKNHGLAEWDSDVHQVEFYFECKIKKEGSNFKGTNPDENQVDVEWIELERLSELRIYPMKLVEQLMNNQKEPRYIGDSN